MIIHDSKHCATTLCVAPMLLLVLTTLHHVSHLLYLYLQLCTLV